VPRKRTDAEWNVGTFALAWTYSKIFKYVANTPNHWCMRKWRSRPTSTWVNLTDFWSPKYMFLLSFRRSSDFWKREYLYNVTFWKRALVTKLESDGWSCCFKGHFFLFSKISFAFSNYVINTPNGCNVWKSSFASEAHSRGR